MLKNMANPIPKPILGSFEDIGENIVSSLKQIPKDVGQAALESVGIPTGSGKKGNSAALQSSTATGSEKSHWQQIDSATDDQTKRIIARKALEELLRPAPQQKEPSIWERIQQEEEQKKAMKAQQAPAAVQLPSSGARKVPGMKSAVKNKSSQQESSKNARQD